MPETPKQKEIKEIIKAAQEETALRTQAIAFVDAANPPIDSSFREAAIFEIENVLKRRKHEKEGE